MSDWLDEQLDAHIRTATDATALLPAVRSVGDVLIDAFERGGTLYTFGNGGSAADAQHFTGEVIGHYRRDRRPLPAVTLSTDATVSTCIANDYAFEDIFSRQVQALARPGDVVAAFTTSGRSQNIVDALSALRLQRSRDPEIQRSGRPRLPFAICPSALSAAQRRPTTPARSAQAARTSAARTPPARAPAPRTAAAPPRTPDAPPPP